MPQPRTDYRRPELDLAFAGSPPTPQLTVGPGDPTPVADGGPSRWAGQLPLRLCLINRGYADAPNVLIACFVDRPFHLEPEPAKRGRVRLTELARTPFGQLAHFAAPILAPGEPEPLPPLKLFVPVAAFRAPFDWPFDYAVMSDVHPRREGTLILSLRPEPAVY
ncbi:MAG TPA: hypothetical protein VFK80_11505 [Limnochordia bacterium]|nr:hypothetical protein [Limnochordia bacterium]